MATWIKRLLTIMVVVTVVAGAVIYITASHKTWHYLNQFRPSYIVLCILFISFGMWMDTLRVTRLVEGAEEHVSFADGLKVVFSNYFLALLTPSAAGGAIAQVYFLHKAGVSLSKCMVIVATRTVFSIAFLFFMFPFVFIYDHELLPLLLSKQVLPLFVFFFAAIIYIIYLLRSKPSDASWLHWLRDKLLSIPKLGPYFRRRGWDRKYDAFVAELWEITKMYGKDKWKLLIEVFIVSGLNLLALYAIVPVLFAGAGLEFDTAQVMGRMIILNFILYFAPTPGGSGIAEGGFVLLYKGLVDFSVLGIVAVVWRLLAEYLPFTVGLIIVIKEIGIAGISALISGTKVEENA